MNEAKYGEIASKKKKTLSRFICIYSVAQEQSCYGCGDEPEECCWH